jgi:hypothetical protein
MLIVRASPTALASARRIHQTAYVSRTPERYEPGLASAASAAASAVRAVMVAERGGLTEVGEHFQLRRWSGRLRSKRKRSSRAKIVGHKIGSQALPLQPN